MKKVLLGFALTGLVATVGCNKEEEAAPAPTPFTKEAVAGSYKITAVTASINGSAEMDASSSFNPCYLDNVTILRTTGTYTMVDAGLQCSPAGDLDGTWSITSNTAIDIGPEAFTKKSWDGKTLVLTKSGDFNGAPATLTTTFTKE